MMPYVTTIWSISNFSYLSICDDLLEYQFIIVDIRCQRMITFDSISNKELSTINILLNILIYFIFESLL